MPRRSEKDRFARVCDLYSFDEQILHWGLGHEDADICILPASPRPPLPPSSHLALAGFDEAGRGALAGPVVVGCVHFEFPTAKTHTAEDTGIERREFSFSPSLPLSPPLSLSPRPSLIAHLVGVDDSKRLSPARREDLFERITALSHWGIGTASAAEIDQLGIVPAVSLAARRAYEAMGIEVDLLLCDRGLTLLGHGDAGTRRHGDTSPLPPELSFTKGDSRSLHIAAASILAKVARDRMMLSLHERFPSYGFASNKGYGTAYHLAALRRCGPSTIHRRSFRVNSTQ